MVHVTGILGGLVHVAGAFPLPMARTEGPGGWMRG